MNWSGIVATAAEANATRDAAMITAVGVVLVAVISLIGIMLQRQTHRKVVQSYKHMNNIETEVDTDGDASPTLGQQVVLARREIADLKEHIDGRITEVQSDVDHKHAHIEKQHAEMWAQIASLAREMTLRRSDR